MTTFVKLLCLTMTAFAGVVVTAKAFSGSCSAVIMLSLPLSSVSGSVSSSSSTTDCRLYVSSARGGECWVVTSDRLARLWTLASQNLMSIVFCVEEGFISDEKRELWLTLTDHQIHLTVGRLPPIWMVPRTVRRAVAGQA